MFTAPTKDPSDDLDYQWDWSTWLADGETIQTVVITSDVGITVDDDSHDDTSVTVWLSGGTAGEEYLVAARITTNQLRTVEKSMRIVVRDN